METTRPRFCTWCGEPIIGEGQFCAGCGRSLAKADNIAAVPSPAEPARISGPADHNRAHSESPSDSLRGSLPADAPASVQAQAPLAPLIIISYALSVLSLGLALITGIPAIACALIARNDPAQRSRAFPALVTAVAATLLGMVIALIVLQS